MGGGAGAAAGAGAGAAAGLALFARTACSAAVRCLSHSTSFSTSGGVPAACAAPERTITASAAARSESVEPPVRL